MMKKIKMPDNERWYLSNRWKENRDYVLSYALALKELGYSNDEVIDKLEEITGKRFSKDMIGQWKFEFKNQGKWHLVEEQIKQLRMLRTSNDMYELEEKVSKMLEEGRKIEDEELGDKLIQLKKWLLLNQISLVDKVNRAVMEMETNDRRFISMARLANEINGVLSKMLEDIGWDGKKIKDKQDVVIIINELNGDIHASKSEN